GRRADFIVYGRRRVDLEIYGSGGIVHSGIAGHGLPAERLPTIGGRGVLSPRHFGGLHAGRARDFYSIAKPRPLVLPGSVVVVDQLHPLRSFRSNPESKEARVLDRAVHAFGLGEQAERTRAGPLSFYARPDRGRVQSILVLRP